MTQPLPTDSAYRSTGPGRFMAGELTRGPWDPGHQHAGPPTALVCRAVEQAAARHGLAHLARLTGNLLRPVPLGEVSVEVHEDYLGRNAAHYSARLLGGGKELARYTALVQREVDTPVPAGTPGHPLPAPPRPLAACEPTAMPFPHEHRSYADLVETRAAEGRMFAGPCCVWFRLRHPLVEGEVPSPFQLAAVAADSGNGVSAALDIRHYSFVNCDLTINLLRRPVGDWVCLDARTELGANGCGLAESALYDELGLIGRATQSLAVRRRG